MTQEENYITIGRRKTAVARVHMKLGLGEFHVNGQTLETYFVRPTLIKVVKRPLELTKNQNRFDFVVRLVGGGKVSQAGALRHGIARALNKFDSKNRALLKEEALLKRDPRMKERKKYGQKGARRRYQFSKR